MRDLQLSPAGSEHKQVVKEDADEAADLLALFYALPADLRAAVDAWPHVSMRTKAAILKLMRPSGRKAK